jgi:MinD-like ATPase involved in chromosome partitioning or flagellar assembly
MNVVLIDADTYGGAIAIRLGIFDEAPGIARACRLAGSDELTGAELRNLAQEVRVKGHPLNVVTGILGSARWPEINRERLDRVISCAREAFDVVVLDVGFSLESDEEISSDILAPRRNAATHAALRSATDIVAVSGGDSVGLARFIRLWSDISETNADARVTVCVNHVVWQREGGTAQDSITAAFSRFAGIRDVVLIPEATDLASRADVRGVPACIVDPKSPFSLALAEVSRRILAEAAPNLRRGVGSQLRDSFREKLRGVRLLG